MLTDPIADMLTRIRNANKAMKDTAEMPTSRIKEEIARVLKDEGYIKDFRVVEVEGQPYSTLVVELKFGRNRQRVITGVKRVSRPGRRVYARKDRLRACSAGSAPRSCPPRPGSSRAAKPPSAASAAK